MTLHPEPGPLRVEPHRMPWGETTVTVVDATGVPVWGLNLYHLLELRNAGKSVAMQQRYMSAIVDATNWARASGIDLEDRIEALEFLSYGETKALQAHLQLNRQYVGGVAVGNAYWKDRCRAVRNFVSWRALEPLQRIVRADDRYLEARLKLDRFCDTVASGIGRHKTFRVLGLTEDQQTALLFAVIPGSALNPFEARHQQRNFAIVLSLYELGCRAGELLGLKRGDLVLSGSRPILTIERRQNDPDDPRSRPANAKTLARPLPVSAPLASVLETWTTKHRPVKANYPGANRSPYVFVSGEGAAMSSNTLEYIFKRLRSVEGVPADLTAHKLRHTWNDRFSKLVDADLAENLRTEMATRVRNFLNGWKASSTQGERYTHRFVEEKGHEMMLKLQSLSTAGAARS
ncbi:tyrosine-type recombinase/integrase [Methylobacterium sp.]|uniref:tyrosine-type recombinase/integrase n=1 Tax=Methylobacterium sp. TaxID=409 RepID=UPI003B02460D